MRLALTKTLHLLNCYLLSVPFDLQVHQTVCVSPISDTKRSLDWLFTVPTFSLQLTGNASDPGESEDRTARMRSKDCHLMGLTWLLSKNRTAYIHIASNVLRAIMMSPDGSNPQSCTLGSDGLPLAVDSVEVSGFSSFQFALGSTIKLLLVSLFVLYYCLMIDLWLGKSLDGLVLIHLQP